MMMKKLNFCSQLSKISILPILSIYLLSNLGCGSGNVTAPIPAGSPNIQGNAATLKGNSSGSSTPNTSNNGSSTAKLPFLSSSSSSFQFPQAQGNTVAVFTVINNSSATAYLPKVVESFDPSIFVSFSETCSKYSLAPSETCTIKVGFNNTQSNTQSGSITIQYVDISGSAGTAVKISFSGPGVTSTGSGENSSGSGSSGNNGSGSGGSNNSGNTSNNSNPMGTYVDPTPVFMKSTQVCGTQTVQDVCSYATPSTFDGSNCYVGTAPWGKAFLYAGNFYYTPKSGTPCASGHPFDGANCQFATANGLNPFIFSNGFYFRPGGRQVNNYRAANCPQGSSFDGSNCYIGAAPWGRGFNYQGSFYYTAQSGTPCANNDYYDGTHCVAFQIPAGWEAFTLQDKLFYVKPRNVQCVQ